MSKAEWPELWNVVFPDRKCREPVWNDVIAHSCDLLDLHKGPCASQASHQSIQRRHQWHKQQEEKVNNVS